MTSKEILTKYLEYFNAKEHKQVPNVSLVPENDPTLLFVNSGMFPLVPYLSGEQHPLGKRLVNVQRCIRMEDIDEVGDHIHTLAFHMIGNWSLGDYFKKDQLPWVYEFFIENLKLDPKRIYASVFAGDEDAPRDEESISIIKQIYKKYDIDAKENERIWMYGKEHNWWKRGDAVGELGGPSSEMFYYLGNEDPEGLSSADKLFGEISSKDFSPKSFSPADNDTEFAELGNSVFMEYKKSETGWEKLKQSNVDYGGGLERIAMAVQHKKDIFQTDNFYPIIQKIEELSGKTYLIDKEETFAFRNLADHIRGCVFLAMDGVYPSNKDQGYILRRLLRRMVRFGRVLGIEKDISVSLVPIVVEIFSWLYSELPQKSADIQNTFEKEEKKFRKTLDKGSKEMQKEDLSQLIISKAYDTLGEFAATLYQSIGYPFEMFAQDLKEKYGVESDFVSSVEERFMKLEKEHKEKSREGAQQKFEGGLADQSEQVIKYHTATHLLHYALRQVLGHDIIQHGSNITGERLRFDFNFDRKLSDEELTEVESIVNELISKKLPVGFEILPKEDALKTGAIHAFNEKYGEQVKVYYVGINLKGAVSKEFCGGPHVKNTAEIGQINIYKQDKIGRGMMRIYAR